MNKLKLNKNESILPENPHIELEVRLKLYELGITQWIDNRSVLYNGARTHHPLAISNDKRYLKLSRDKSTISGTEWVNRHGIFIQGQKVLVRDDDTLDWERRIWIHGNVCVATGDENSYRLKKSFNTYIWREVKSPYPPFKEEKPTIHIPEGDYSVKQIEEFLKNGQTM